MDARTLSAVVGIEVVTLNAWISRGYVPGITADAQGRRRDFDIETAAHIAIMADLVRLGWSAPLAFAIASQRGTYNYLVFGNSDIVQKIGPMPVSLSPATTEVVGFESMADLPDALAEFSGGAPSTYLIIDVNKVIVQVTSRLELHDKWVRAGRPTNFLRAYAWPEEMEASPAPGPAPSNPPARRQRRKTR